MLLIGTQPNVKGGVIRKGLFRRVYPFPAPINEFFNGSFLKCNQVVWRVLDQKRCVLSLHEQLDIFVRGGIKAANAVSVHWVFPYFALFETAKWKKLRSNLRILIQSVHRMILHVPNLSRRTSLRETLMRASRLTDVAGDGVTVSINSFHWPSTLRRGLLRDKPCGDGSGLRGSGVAWTFVIGEYSQPGG